jgi:hypothetical protein
MTNDLPPFHGLCVPSVYSCLAGNLTHICPCIDAYTEEELFVIPAKEGSYSSSYLSGFLYLFIYMGVVSTSCALQKCN